MSFLIHCLVMRTLYQAGMFQMLQTDLRKPEFSSLDEILDEDYTIYYYFGEKDAFMDEKFS